MENGAPKQIVITGSSQISRDDRGLITIKQFAIAQTPKGPQVIGHCEAQFNDPEIGKALCTFLAETIKLTTGSVLVPGRSIG